MKTKQTEQESSDVGHEDVLACIRAMIGESGHEQNEDPLPPTPWDPVVRAALERIGERVGLNPQPLPPRYAFMIAVAQTVISRAQLLQEVVDAMPRQQEGGIDVGGYTSRLADDFCGTGFKLRYPFPGPRPQWFASELDGIDLVVMATQFERAAKEAVNPSLCQSLADASAKLVEAGCSKMQSATREAGYARSESGVRPNTVAKTAYPPTASGLRTNAVPTTGYSPLSTGLRTNSVPTTGYPPTASGQRINTVTRKDTSRTERVRTFGSLD